MTILITGASGYVGSQIVHTLHRTFNQPAMIGVDNLSTGHTCPLPNDFTCFMGDVGHTRFMANLIETYKVKQIIHCAASVSLPESVARPLDYYQNNTVNSLGLIKLAQRLGVKGFVFSSTAAVYGEGLGRGMMRETDTPRPIAPYGWSKWMTEQMLQDTCQAHNMSAVILRYFNVAGADPLGLTGPTNPKPTHLIARAVRAALGKEDCLTIYGDGTQVRDYIHVADLAAAHLGALEFNARHESCCLTLNVGLGYGYSVNRVVEAVRKASVDFPCEIAQRREGDPDHLVADRTQIYRKFGWEPQYNLNRMVEHAISWERNR